MKNEQGTINKTATKIKKMLIELTEEEVTLRLANIMLNTEKPEPVKVIEPDLFSEDGSIKTLEETMPEPVESKWATSIETYFDNQEVRNEYENWLKENYGEEKNWSDTKWAVTN